MDAPPTAPREMRICMLSDDFVPAATGVGSHLQSITSLLAARGHAVSVVTTRRRGQGSVEQWRGVDVLRVATVKLFGFYQAVATTAALGRILDRLDPDLVHHHYVGMMLLRASAAARARRIPQVYTYHMTADHLTQPLPMRPFRGLIARAIARQCERMDQIISVSENLARQLRRDGLRAPIVHISNPVDSVGEQRPPAPAEAGDGFTVLFVGRLNPEKNVGHLLRGFHALHEVVPRARLWIAGDGSQRPQLQALARSLGVLEATTFLGHVPREDLGHWYRRCDVFVLPSLVETQGLVALEAMSHGKPLLVTRCIVSASELVDDGVNGYLIDERDPADLCRRLLELHRDPALRLRMGDAGQRRVQGLGPAAVVAQLEAIYAQVLERAGPALDSVEKVDRRM